MKINKLLIATHNQGKFKESQVKLSKDLGIEIVSLADLGIIEDYKETGQTYEENAMAKAKFYYNLSKIPTMADDSGLSVEALGGEPGVHSRTWPGYTATDEELLQMLLDKMKDVPAEKRSAKFVTVVAFYDGQEELIARGEQLGTIASQLICKMDKGLPYSAVFYPDGYDKVFSELTIDQKNAISHRGRALEQIIKQLK
ncbi:MAG: RdgB/HAM1 family non-canonical purine NTP pyrophosphatase [Patescibacteria group bacterium]